MIRGALARALASPRAPLAAVALAFVLALPTLGAGLFLDDWMHRVDLDPRWHSPHGIRGPWDLYHFFTDDPGFRRTALDRGLLPWWTAPALRLAFLRPLASLTIAFDLTALWGHPWLMHLHNALWVAALAAAAWAVYRRAFAERRVAALAAVLYAVDHTRAMLVVWLANRHALMSAVFAFAAFAAHLRGRREGWRPGVAVGASLFAVSLACGETGLSLLAYLVPFAAFADPAPLRERVRSLAPYVLLAAAWAALYRQQDCGAYGGDLYVDPVRQPLTYALGFVARAPVLALGQVLLPPSEFLPPTGPAVGVAVAAFLALVLRPLVALVRADPMARVWAAGALLSLVPASATMPNDRLLVCASLGAMGLLARAIDAAWWSGPEASRGARAVVGVLAVIHLGLSPLLQPARALQIATISRGYLARCDASLPSDAGLADDLVVAVTAPDPLTTPYAFMARNALGRPWPRRGARLLVTPSRGTTTLRREGAHAVVLEATEPMPHDKLGVLYRGVDHPFRAGEVVETAGMRAEVLACSPAGRALRVRFTFDRALDDPSLRWVAWIDGRFRPFAMPADGATVTLTPINWLRALAGP